MYPLNLQRREKEMETDVEKRIGEPECGMQRKKLNVSSSLCCFTGSTKQFATIKH